jgi:ubiquinone/menaquinone biosynthesis C-methylase UbiE
MPFEDCRFDYLVCRAAFKNFSRPHAALDEMYRVLKPGGCALIIDMRRDASHESMRQAANEMKAGALNREIVYLTFRFMLLRRAYTKAEFEQMFGRTGFRGIQIRENLIGLDITAFRASDHAPGHPVS